MVAVRDSAGNDDSEARHERVENRRMVKAAEELVARMQELVEEKLEKSSCPDAWESQCEEAARKDAERVMRKAVGEIHKEYATSPHPSRRDCGTGAS